MKPVAYIIYSEKLDKFYIGKSENFTQRISMHNSDQNQHWTKTGQPWKEFLIVNCNSYAQAGKIEHYIKAQKSRKFISELNQNPGRVEKLCMRFSDKK
jgi:putative endonuclease